VLSTAGLHTTEAGSAPPGARGVLRHPHLLSFFVFFPGKVFFLVPAVWGVGLEIGPENACYDDFIYIGC